MKLVWTYKTDVYPEHSDRYNIIRGYYNKSFDLGKQVGYETELWSNREDFVDLVDNHKVVPLPIPLFWDALKIEPFRNYNTGFLNIDPDIFFHKKLILPNTSIVFDGFEKGRGYNLLYKESIDKLTELGVKEFIPEWKPDIKEICCVGVLAFNDVNFQQLFVERYDTITNFVNKHKEHFDLKRCTTVAMQYLLTTLIDYYKVDYTYFSKKLGERNEFYTHMIGKSKFTSTRITQKQSLI
jgi:hypothetical protein